MHSSFKYLIVLLIINLTGCITEIKSTSINGNIMSKTEAIERIKTLWLHSPSQLVPGYAVIKSELISCDEYSMKYGITSERDTSTDIEINDIGGLGMITDVSEEHKYSSVKILTFAYIYKIKLWHDTRVDVVVYDINDHKIFSWAFKNDHAAASDFVTALIALCPNVK